MLEGKLKKKKNQRSSYLVDIIAWWTDLLSRSTASAAVPAIFVVCTWAVLQEVGMPGCRLLVGVGRWGRIYDGGGGGAADVVLRSEKKFVWVQILGAGFDGGTKELEGWWWFSQVLGGKLWESDLKDEVTSD